MGYIMKIIKLFVLIFAMFGVTSYVNATGAGKPVNKQGEKIKQEAEFQEVIDEYKAYVSMVKPEIRDEVIAYRKEIAKLNKQKRLHYRKLSQDAQDYLKKEQEFKKRLPRNKQDLFKSNTGQQQQKENEKSDN